MSCGGSELNAVVVLQKKREQTSLVLGNLMHLRMQDGIGGLGTRQRALLRRKAVLLKLDWCISSHPSKCEGLQRQGSHEWNMIDRLTILFLWLGRGVCTLSVYH